MAEVTPLRPASSSDSSIELVCPAGTPAALTAAVEAGADAIYFGFRDRTNARNFPGLNFTEKEAGEAVATCRAHGVKPMIAVNTYPDARDDAIWRRAVDVAADLAVDGLIVCDMGLLAYAAKKHPNLRLHLSVQASASNPEAVKFYQEAFGIKRVVLPRVMSVSEIADLTRAVAPVETEVFVFGGLCVMAEGRCALSSYATGLSPNKDGVCSPASHVRYEQEGDVMVSRLGAFTINRFDAGESAGYPTLCKGRFASSARTGHLFEDPTSLDATTILPELKAAGVKALKVEGRQRGKAYVAQVVRSLRAAIDSDSRLADPATRQLMEGQGRTEGAYRRDWR
ncbi:ubiquinone anaerobic biosynthesis protein UbiU [Pararhodospirillum oryzae]|uniref:Ubiquinone biosynthesis protein UbiU n=1 Tax=Pararhodospirillum oryzae TaxID=478448 RepID=A0A512H508_9PROT|nr:peptidase U32 family protein [Pararhodospirillum oryzae]GEO80555.1 protease [Pararhodospirillum oryzae]